MEPKKRAVIIVISSDSEDDDKEVTRVTPLGLEASRISSAAGTKSERMLAVASQPARGSKSALGLVQTAGVPVRPSSFPAAEQLVRATAVKPLRAAIRASRVAAVPSELWADSAANMAPDDLAVHKAKVREVHEWLLTAVASAGLGKRQESCQASPRLLILLGPPGTGKSTTGGWTAVVASALAGVSVVSSPLARNARILRQ